MKILGRGAEWPHYLIKNENNFGGMDNSKVFSMKFSKVYPLLVAKGRPMVKILR